MGMHNFQPRFTQLRARLKNAVPPGGDRRHALEVLPRLTMRGALVLVAILAMASIGAAGYLLGASNAIDERAATAAGEAAGEVRGVAVGARDGWEATFRSARERAYDAAYARAARAAYLEELDQADLATPRTVRLSVP